MKYLLITFLGFVLVIGFAGCEYGVISSDEDLLVEFGTECGWCVGEEMISITSSKIEYTRTIPCGENKGVTKKSKSITKAELDSINSALDYNLFKTLEYNECNVCVDGCDEIIRISKNKNTHEIRYTPGKKISEIENLRYILNKILLEMQNKD